MSIMRPFEPMARALLKEIREEQHAETKQQKV
jgi:hypothetical protein